MPTNKKKTTKKNQRKKNKNENSTSNRNQAGKRKDDIPDDVFEEFLKWSLSDKEDINARKFEKKAPRAAELLKEHNPNTIVKRLVKKREERLEELEKQSNEYDTNLYRNILIESMTGYFKSEGEKFDFGQQLDAAIKRKEKKIPLSTLALKVTFEEVAEKWAKQRIISLENNRYYQKDPFTILKLIEEDKVNMIKMESDIFQRYEEIKEKLVYKSYAKTHFMNYDIGDTLFMYACNFRLRYTCWCCCRDYHLICSSCKCARYCSKECQVKHWKTDHKKKCKYIGDTWSLYLSNKQRLHKGVKDKRIWTDKLYFDADENSRECFLRPSPSIDTFLSSMVNMDSYSSPLHKFYEQMAILSCGGKHPLFGNETVNPALNLFLEHLGSDCNDEDLTLPTDGNKMLLTNLLRLSFKNQKIEQNEIDAMVKYAFEIFADLPGHNESSWKERIEIAQKETKCNSLTLDKFLTLYTCFDPLDLYNEVVSGDKYTGEFVLLTTLKSL